MNNALDRALGKTTNDAPGNSRWVHPVQSKALRAEGSENAGLGDEWFAIKWVRDKIARFGGDPNKITIFGQSSSGLAVSLQIMAYGAAKPVPLQQAICQSQVLEPGHHGQLHHGRACRYA